MHVRICLELTSNVQVGTHAVLTRPPNAQRGEGERKLQLLIRAEGPTRVLSVTDLQVRHAMCRSSTLFELISNASGSTEMLPTLAAGAHALAVDDVSRWRRIWLAKLEQH